MSAAPEGAGPAIAAPDEGLPESAPLARRLAGERCRVDPATGRSCAWYHGLWQDLRLLGLAPSLAGHLGFLAAAFAGARTRTPRLLVSGAADQGLLAQALAACGAAGLAPRVTVLDLCATPLALCRWYADRVGRELGTAAGDILAHRPPAPYELICAHGFAGLFPPAARRALLAHWVSLLAPGGALVLVNRLREGDPGQPLGFAAAEAAALRATALERLEARPGPGAADRALIRGRLEEYLASMRVHPLPEAELRRLVAEAGLRLERWELQECEPGGLRGPATTGGGPRVCLVARRGP